ncbi:TetR/AcrR family transcriptional regulator C-terminal domain-containing protein [Streptomyces sp. NPDC058420]|uniref:TetR/AcrR family transcriptional regulator C-terminal domain-containing protein n=1 Tax=Streptomyces sp. NPDC058420 TaxID=3346489 RepID=UPI0036680B37
MRRAGFNGVAALWATSTVFCYALGEALEQQGLTDDARDRLAFPGARRTYPHLFSTPVEEILNFDDLFAFGLGLILGGLPERIPGEGSSLRAPPPSFRRIYLHFLRPGKPRDAALPDDHPPTPGGAVSTPPHQQRCATSAR